MGIKETKPGSVHLARWISHGLSPIGAAILVLWLLPVEAAARGWQVLCLALYVGVPLAALLQMMWSRRKRTAARDVYDPDPAHRRRLLWLGIGMYGAFLVVLLAAGAPALFLWAGTTFLAGAAGVCLINRVWKISIHGTGIGGAVGLLALQGAANWPLTLALPALVIWARLVLGAHSASQVVAGVLFGAAVAAASRGLYL